MKELLGLIAVALTIIGHYPYIKDTIQRRTKPHVFTWIVWALVTLLAFLGQYQKGGGAGSWTTGVTGIITIAIAILALKNGTKDITRSDKIFFTAALLSVIPWLLTSDPTISVVILTFIDASAFIPTIRKTLRDRTSETLFTYSLNILRHGLAIAALQNYNLATYLYPSSLLLMNSVMTFIILNPKFKRK